MSCTSPSSDDEPQQSDNGGVKTISDKTFIISTGSSKTGESSSTSVPVNRRDSQTVYSSSFKDKNKSAQTNLKVAPVDIVPSPAESTATNEASEVSDFDAGTNLDLVDELENSPQTDYSVFSPLEKNKLSDERVEMILSKGEKTPHSGRKRPAISYK